MMRKIVLLYLILIFCGKATAQSEKNIGDLPEPVASVSSYSTYTNVPVNLSTGIPEINIPLFNLETNKKLINVPVFLRYHPNNAKKSSMAGEVGLGWSIYGVNVISRSIVGELDERLDDASKSYYTKNEFDDIYFYNIPGYSGKFRFIRDVNNNTFTLKHLSNNNLKIEYTRTSNTATLILQSFTITDKNGIKYLFEDYSTALRTRPIGTNELSVYFKSSFYLSKIIDENNIEQVNFTYQKKIKYSNGDNGIDVHLLYEISKPLTIESSFGKINFEYNYNQNFEYDYDNDPYSIVSITLQNKQSVIISKYIFTYDYVYFTMNNNKRILNNLKNVNNNSQTIEERKFEYNTNGSNSVNNFYTSGDPCDLREYENPNTFSKGTLKKIILNGKGSIIYNFEAGENYADKSNYIPNYFYIQDPAIEYFSNYNINFNTSLTKIYNLQINIPRRIHIFFTEETNNNPILNPRKPDLEPYQAPLSFLLKNSSGQVLSASYCGTFDSNRPTKYELAPGNYTLNVIGSGTGNFSILQIESLPTPYKNVNYGNVVRIKSIEFFDSNNIKVNSKNYSYNSFTNPLDPSGATFFGNTCVDYENNESILLYRNIKVTEDNGINGYTKYYFNTPSDFPPPVNDYLYKPYYDLVVNGLLSKVEIYNNQNNLLKSIDINYTLDEVSNGYVNDFCYGYTKQSWLKNKTEIIKEYYANNSILQKSIETNYNINNFETSSSKEVSSDGTVTEMFIKYAGDKNIQNLINANMISVPLETEVKKNNKTIGKTETKYENTTNLFPSSVVSTNPNDASTKTTIKYENYDANGNLVQYTTDYDSTNSLGNPVTIIWGYNKTLPIAKIEGAKLSDIGILANDIVTKSNADIDATTENTLLSALDTFRNETTLKNYLITTYTYDPLIGMTTITPPNGMRQIYKYDAKNQLEFVVDTNGNIIKQMKYNTKQ